MEKLSFEWLKRSLRQLTGHQNQEHTSLILIASLPAFAVTLITLFTVGASGYLIAFVSILISLIIIYTVATAQRRSRYQLQTLTNLIEAIIHEDYTLRGVPKADLAYQELLNSVNQLADTLQKQKIRLAENGRLLDIIVDQIDAILIIVDESHNVTMCNQAAKIALAVNEAGGVLSELELNAITAYQDSGVIRFEKGKLKGEHFLFTEKLIVDRQAHQLFLLTRADRLLREKEREAWQNLLRVLSHEINNSLTPIATISGSLLKKETSKTAQKENSLSKGLAIVKERAESLKQFVSGYSRLYHLPLPNKELCQLDDLFKRIFPLFPDCMLINKTDKQLTSFKPIYIDSGQVEQVFVNLMKNAEESMSHLTQKVIEFDIHEESNWLHIYIQDSGIGLANTYNLFVPFYTTKENGSGIGLMLSQQILLNHNGAISLENREDTIGARATISIPIAKQ